MNHQSLPSTWRNSLALLTGALLGLPSSAAGEPQEDPKSVPVFKDGQAQVVAAFKDQEDWIQFDLWVEAEFDSNGDGLLDRMHVDVTLPRQTETEGLKVSVIYETSPYFSGVSSGDAAYMWDPVQELGSLPPFRENPPEIPHQARKIPMSRSLISTWVPRGFGVVHSASPGTGLSQGCPTVGAANEALAPKAVIDWLNGRAKGFTSPDGDETIEASWSTGKVGMTGTSYNGMLPIFCASTGVEGLEAIIPVSAGTSFYNYYRSNGLVRHPGGYMGEDVDVLYDFIHSGDPNFREYCNSRIRDEVMLDGFDRTNGDYNEFWSERDYTRIPENYHAATFLAHGLNDWNVMPSHSINMFEALKRRSIPTRLYLHQGGHGGPPPLAQMNRWFSRYLYGVENQVEKDSLSLVMREGAKRGDGPTPYADYPHPEAERVRLQPLPGGNQLGALALDAAAPKRVEKLVDDVKFSGAMLAADSRSKHRLLYATQELKTPLHISGIPRIQIQLSSDKPAANLSVWLVSLPWEPTEDPRKLNDNLITRGWADPQNRGDLSHSSPLKSKEWIDLSFELEPEDQIIPAGQRIGLMIFSSDRDFTLWPKAGTQLSVQLGGTSLELPVVGGAAAFRKAFE